VALQKARREQAARRNRGGDSDDDEGVVRNKTRGGTLEDDAAVFGNPRSSASADGAARDAKRRKIDRAGGVASGGLDSPFGGPL
jgi:hypothetical protein